MNEEMNQIIEQQPAQEQQEEYSEELAMAQCNALIEALTEAKIKLSLLLCGASKEKLEEAAKLSAAFVAAGLTPEEAAEKTVSEYPHLKLVTREVPTFAAQSSGSGDGFGAIRSIFAKH